jgi:excisionase family DNA binding protein
MPYWLRIGQAARLLDLSVDTLRKWDREARLRARRTPGDHRRYAGPDIQALAARLGRGPATPLRHDQRSRQVRQPARNPQSLPRPGLRPSSPQALLNRQTAIAARQLRTKTTPCRH